MQGLFRRETEPRATGHKSLIARKNQRRTSSDVSFLFMYRCNIAPVHNALSMTTLVLSSPRASTSGRCSRQGSIRCAQSPGTTPGCVVPHLHLLTLLPSLLYLVPLYASKGGFWCSSDILCFNPVTFYLSSHTLGCVWLGWTSEFFESEDNVLQGFDIRDLVQRRDLQLIEQPLHRVRVEPLGNSFQAVKAARCGLQHL